MNYRPLGKTGISVSEIGFGAWGIGGSKNGDVAYGPTNVQDSLDALQYAVSQGINFFDTSNFYGFGHSEELIGEAFKACREQVVLATKVGLLDADGNFDFSQDYIQKTFEGSLLRLKTDYIDLYQLHSPPIELLVQEPHIVSVLESLKKSERIRACGISVRSPEDGLIALDYDVFDTIQVNFNMLDQRVVDNGFLEQCEKRQVGVIARTPLCFGFLTGQYQGNETFHHLDHRSKWSDAQIKVWANGFKYFTDDLTQVYQQTPAQIALRFCLAYAGISTVIPGMLTPDQVKENAGASDLGGLSLEERHHFEDIYHAHTFFVRK